MNIANLTKEHRYEFVCVILALILLLALWPALRLGSDAKAKAVKARELDNRITKVRRRGPDGVATELLVKAHDELAKQAELEADQVAGLFMQRNQRQFLLPGVFPDGKNLFGFRDGYKKAIDTLYEQTLRASWPKDDPDDSSPEKAPTDIAIYVETPKDLGIPEWVHKRDYAPDAEDCWFGQLALWVQQDLVQVFSELNIASAEQIEQQPSVANAVVKRIIYIDINPSYYVGDLDARQKSPTGTERVTDRNRRLQQRRMPAGLLEMGMMDGLPRMPGLPAIAPKVRPKRSSTRRKDKAGFTERSSNDQADVVRLSFSVIVDSRSIDKLLGALNRKNLYTVLNVSLSRQDVEIDSSKFEKFNKESEDFNPRQDAARGLIYGTDPVVKLDVDAEVLFLREIYAESMPEQIKSTGDRQTAQAPKKIITRRSSTGSRIRK